MKCAFPPLLGAHFDESDSVPKAVPNVHRGEFLMLAKADAGRNGYAGGSHVARAKRRAKIGL